MDEIQLISDGNGLAVIGEASAVERFLGDAGIESSEFNLPRLSALLSTGSGLAQAGSEVLANSGQWVKLTPKSAAAVKKFGLTPVKDSDFSYAMIGKPGRTQQWLQIAKAPGSLAANPAVLSGAAGVMAQLAMKQAMDEITDYLARIDEKLDDLLRAQKDSVLARMIGVGLEIEAAMRLREHVGGVSDVTWSKVQGVSGTIAETQAYALLQLDALADKIERAQKIGALADATEVAQVKTREWLAVLARCFQLQDGLAILEIDRVMDSTPADLDRHREGLRAAREHRVAAIAQTTERLLERISGAAGAANEKVLFHPSKSPAIAEGSGQVIRSVAELHQTLGIEARSGELAVRRWSEAASAVREKVAADLGERLEDSRRRGGAAVERAKDLKGRIAADLAERRRRSDAAEESDEDA